MTERMSDLALIDHLVSTLAEQFNISADLTSKVSTANSIGVLLQAKADIARSYNNSNYNSGGTFVFGQQTYLR